MEGFTSYKTIEKESHGEISIRKSKFIAVAHPVQHESQIKDIVADQGKKHPKSKHHCYAWRLGTDGNQFRTHDAGEPSGTAGRPILAQIDARNLTNIIVIVSRYFGGILLGANGLTKAYRSAASIALENSIIIEKQILAYYTIHFGYKIMPQLMEYLNGRGIKIVEQSFQETCSLKCAIIPGNEDDFINYLNSKQVNSKFLYLQ